MGNEVIELRSFRLWLGEDGVFRAVILPDAELMTDDVKEAISAKIKIAGPEKSPVLIDTREFKFKFVPYEVRKHGASTESAIVISALALLGDSVFARILPNIFINFNKPVYPTRFFTSEPEAIEWLKGFLG